jgi:hypothetical protein
MLQFSSPSPAFGRLTQRESDFFGNPPPLEPSSRGIQIQVKYDMLLEGFRLRRIVRFYPDIWKVVALPRGAQLFGRE